MNTALNTNLNHEQEVWVKLHHNQAQQILDYINDNNNSAEAQNIGQTILNYTINSPFNLDTSELANNILLLPNDSIPCAIKLKCVYKKLTETPKLNNYLIMFLNKMIILIFHLNYLTNYLIQQMVKQKS